MNDARTMAEGSQSKVNQPYLFYLGVTAALLIAVCGGAARGSDLAGGFQTPPTDCRPGAWWRFFGDVMTTQGAEEDVREMAAAGFDQVQMVHLVGKPKGGTGVFLSQPWWDVMRAGGREAGKQGIHISPSHMTGWSSAGGPWIPAGKSMQKLVWSTMRVEGKGDVTLPHPETVLNYYRDVAVLAYPVSGDVAASSAEIPNVQLLEGKLQPKQDLACLVDGKPETVVKFVTSDAFPPTEFLQLEFAYNHPVTLRSLMIDPFIEASHASGELANYGGKDAEIQAETEPGKFVKVATIAADVTVFPATRAQRFRIRMHVPSPFVGRQIREIDLSPETKLVDLAKKAGYFSWVFWKPHPQIDRSSPAIDPAQVVNLTDKMDAQGKLNWTPPQGAWLVVRFGQTSSNRPTRNAAVPGLESDKLDPDATRLHFDSFTDKIAKAINQESPGNVNEIFMDSWEGGSQNWTAKMPQLFQKYRGYDLMPYLLTLTGRMIGTVDQTERFLWDYRRTLADILADNFYSVMREKSNAIGAKLTSQGPGPSPITPIADFLQCWGRIDIPMGEYLSPPQLSASHNTKEASSAAHIYGKPVVTAEDFSLFSTRKAPLGDIHGGGQFNSPREMLQAQYLAFCEGLNRVTLTCFVHQADRTQGTVKDPGWGPVLNAPWFSLAKGYTDYLTRCQYLLRQGLFVADICYFYGEGAPNKLHHVYQPDLNEPNSRPRDVIQRFPAGYDYDECNAEAFLTRMSVKDGRLVLPDGPASPDGLRRAGMSYSILVLPDLQFKGLAYPDHQTMTVPVIEKLAEWVKAGLTVVGPKPLRSPSLVEQPQADARVRQLADELWGDCDGVKVTEHAYGKGRVVWGQSVEQVLHGMKINQDFASMGEGKEFLYIHRRQEQRDIYFVFNRSTNWTTRICSFRVTKATPEVWDAVPGVCRPAVFRSVAGGTELAISLPPYGATFVVFDAFRPAAPQVAAVSCDGKAVSVNGVESAAMPAAELRRDAQGRTEFLAWRKGRFEITDSDGTTKTMEVRELPLPLELAGPWAVSFKPMAPADKPFQVTMEKLIPWQQHTDRKIRYFGGQATYRTTVTVDAQMVKRPMMLDLGSTLGDVAEVKVNGKPAGSVWMAPYRVDVAGLIQTGANTVEITVANRWINRLIGELQTAGEPVPAAMMRNPFKDKDTPLVEAGLAGPVVLRAAEPCAF
jgi:hypothetical protein